MIREIEKKPWSGWIALPMQLLLLPVAIAFFVGAIAAVAHHAETDPEHVPGAVVGIVIGALALVAWALNWIGFFVVSPNESRVVLFFGRYVGTVRRVGFHYVNPFSRRRRVSLKVRTFETGSQDTVRTIEPGAQGMGRVVVATKPARGHPIKVNDRDGNPIEITAVVVWRVADTAEALFNVDDYEQFVAVQSEAALRNLASQYHYDSVDDGSMSLRGNTDAVGERLQAELAARMEKAGVEIIEARISSLAYAPEIAAAMLQRQQAGAVVAARQRLVDGAVGMVEMALTRLEERRTVELTNAQKAGMVANLLVVLCSERGAQPIVSASSAKE